MARLDPHSCTDSEHPAARRLEWRARVDFEARRLEAEARLHFDAPVGGALDLDTRGLDIASVRDDADGDVPFRLGDADAVLGTPLHLVMPRPTRWVEIRYRTDPNASALQWLSPAQTSGGRHPFLFSQCQAIHARSVVPLQDTPRARIAYTAELTVPVALRGLMAAAFESREEAGALAVERYAMRHPIPPYLFALAVGDLVSAELGPRSRVWAEPPVIARAAHEFAAVDAMLTASEALFGPYDWDRFDILTMPSSFPYGGMENPCLTFLTPTLLAGDRSLVNVVAHELAHSWTGNLVSNADAEHFWLNEGFTVFAERRILEALEGTEASGLHAAIGYRGLEEAVDELRDRPQLTCLRTHLHGVDPDEVYSLVPYEKGYLFLRCLEEAVGRARFDAFLRRYLDAHRFGSITTETFTAFVEAELPGVLAAISADAWLHQGGIPENAPRSRSARLDRVLSLGADVPTGETAQSWTPTEWQLYLESVPRPAPASTCEALDLQHGLTRSDNAEILFSWLTLAVTSGYDAVLPRVDDALGEVGRLKFLKPLYVALAARPETRERAHRIYARHRDGYHPIAQQVLGQLLEGAPAACA